MLDGLNNMLKVAGQDVSNILLWTCQPSFIISQVEAVAAMVEECGGLDRIEALQSHENEQIYHKALQIIETFFPDGEQVILNILC